MTRKKRASMREGPLADLFRSTEESVPAEDDRGLHPVSLPYRAYEVADARHAHSVSESEAKLKGEGGEVKRYHSLEFTRARR